MCCWGCSSLEKRVCLALVRQRGVRGQCAALPCHGGPGWWAACLSAAHSFSLCTWGLGYSSFRKKERVEGKPLLRKHAHRSCLHPLCPISPPPRPGGGISGAPRGEERKKCRGPSWPVPHNTKWIWQNITSQWPFWGVPWAEHHWWVCAYSMRLVQKTFSQLGGGHRVHPVYECGQCDCWTHDCKVNVENDALFHTGVYFNCVLLKNGK